MLNLYWFKHKNIFECFRCFWKVFCFYKNWKFRQQKKQCCPVLATQSRAIQVACHSRELAGRFWRFVREWKVQSRGVHRDFHGSARDSLASETSSRGKLLANFFKTFLVFPRTFYDYSLSLSTETDPNTPCHFLQTPFLHHLISRSSRKMYGFSLSHLIFHVLSIISLIFELSLCFEIYCVRTCFCLDCWVWVGCFCCWFHLLS